MSGLIVTGMHRSGTSLTARLLAAGGWHPGEELLVGAREEYFEDAAVVALHRSWLPLHDGIDSHADWGVIDGAVTGPGRDDTDAADRRRVAVQSFAQLRSAQRTRWAAKDPRASLFLDDWASVDALRFVLVYRSPWDSVDSALRTGEPIFCRKPGIARKAWLGYNGRLLDFATHHRDRCLVLAAEGLAADPQGAWRVLDEFAGMDGDASHQIVNPLQLVRRDDSSAIASLYRDVYPEHAQLLERLDAIADLPRPTPLKAETLKVALPGGALPAGTGVQVIVPCRNDGDFLLEAVASADECADGSVELTVVDDGSTDPDTLQVLGALRAAGRHVVATGGGGLAAARNIGCATSGTLAVLPLDADNRVRPSLVAAHRLLDTLGVDIVHGAWRRFGIHREVVHPRLLRLEAVIPRNTIDTCAVIRRSHVELVGGWLDGLPFWEDWEFWIHSLRVGARSHLIDSETFDYLVRPESLSSLAAASSELHLQVVRKVVRRHLRFLGVRSAYRTLREHKRDAEASRSVRPTALRRAASRVRRAVGAGRRRL